MLDPAHVFFHKVHSYCMLKSFGRSSVQQHSREPTTTDEIDVVAELGTRWDVARDKSYQPEARNGLRYDVKPHYCRAMTRFLGTEYERQRLLRIL